MPEFYRSIELFRIIIPQPGGQRIEQKQRVGLPGMPLGQPDIPVAHGLRLCVDRGKIRSLHPADQLHPDR